MNIFWIATVGFLFGMWCGIMLAYSKLHDANDELEKCWEYINELEDDLELYNA
jgi:hypothetical protein